MRAVRWYAVVSSCKASGQRALAFVRGGVSHDITWFHLVRGDIEHRVHRHDADKTSREAEALQSRQFAGFTNAMAELLARRSISHVCLWSSSWRSQLNVLKHEYAQYRRDHATMTQLQAGTCSTDS